MESLNDIPGLKHWVDADDPSTILMSADNIGFVHTWLDKSENGNDLVQVNPSSQPRTDVSITNLEGKLTMDVKKEEPKTKDEPDFTIEEGAERQDYRSRQRDLLRPKLKPPALADSPLVKAAEDWLLARGTPAPYRSGQTIRLSLVFNLIDSGECELSYTADRETLPDLKDQTWEEWKEEKRGPPLTLSEQGRANHREFIKLITQE